MSQARNIGIRFSTGEYIAFVDADDWIDPFLFDHLIRAAEKYDADIVMANHYNVYDISDKHTATTTDAIGISELVFSGDSINQYMHMFMLKGKKEFKPYFSLGQPWAMLYKSELIKDNDLHFFVGMQYKEDVLFNMYAAQFASTIVRIDEPLYFYNRCNVNSLTRSGLKHEMLGRIQRDISERVEFGKIYRKRDSLFWEGIKQHVSRSFIRNIVPACALDYDYKKLMEIYSKELYKNAIKESNKSYLKYYEKIILFVILHGGLKVYYSIIWILLRVQSLIHDD